MALATACAEFPDYTVLHAMSVFNLKSPDLSANRMGKAKQSGLADDDNEGSGGGAPQSECQDVTKPLATLAESFALDKEKLIQQFLAMEPLAQTTLIANRCSQREAWRCAIQRSQADFACTCSRSVSN